MKVVELVFPQRYGLWERFKTLVNKWEQIEAMLPVEDYVVVRPNSVKSLSDERRR